MALRQVDDVLVDDGKQLIPFPGADPGRPGKAPEGRQDGVVLSEVITGKGEGLFPRAIHRDGRVEVTGEEVIALWRRFGSGFGWVVVERKPARFPGPFMYFDIALLLPRTRCISSAGRSARHLRKRSSSLLSLE